MKKLFNLSGILLILLFVCSTPKSLLPVKSAIPGSSQGEAGQYGEPVDEEGALDVASVFLADLEESDDIKVKGKIKEVCQEMGCWITLELPENKTLRVTTEEKFFLPMDISGRIAIVQGKLTKEVTSVEQLRHFAEDAGKDQDYINAITEPREEYGIVARGVKVLAKD